MCVCDVCVCVCDGVCVLYLVLTGRASCSGNVTPGVCAADKQKEQCVYRLKEQRSDLGTGSGSERDSDLGFEQAAVGRVRCASSLPLLPLRLDFCSERKQLSDKRFTVLIVV